MQHLCIHYSGAFGITDKDWVAVNDHQFRYTFASAEPSNELGRVGPSERFSLLCRSAARDEPTCRHKRPVDNRATTCERTSSPPEMNSRDVALAGRLFPGGLGADRHDWQVVLDQPLVLVVHVFPSLVAR